MVQRMAEAAAQEAALVVLEALAVCCRAAEGVLLGLAWVVGLLVALLVEVLALAVTGLLAVALGVAGLFNLLAGLLEGHLERVASGVLCLLVAVVALGAQAYLVQEVERDSSEH